MRSMNAAYLAVACLGAGAAAASDQSPPPACVEVRPAAQSKDVAVVENRCGRQVRLFWRICPLTAGDTTAIFLLAPGEKEHVPHRRECQVIFAEVNW